MRAARGHVGVRAQRRARRALAAAHHHAHPAAAHAPTTHYFINILFALVRCLAHRCDKLKSCNYCYVYATFCNKKGEFNSSDRLVQIYREIRNQGAELYGSPKVPTVQRNFHIGISFTQMHKDADKIWRRISLIVVLEVIV